MDQGDTSASRDPNDVSVEEPSTRALKPGHHHCASWRSVLMPRDANRLRVAYAIPENVAIRIPGLDAGAEPSDKTQDVCVYERMFKVGVRLPLLPVIQELLLELRLAPSQNLTGGASCFLVYNFKVAKREASWDTLVIIRL
jgi:hypothetical protein